VSRGVTTKTAASGAVTIHEWDGWAAPSSSGAKSYFNRLKRVTDSLGNSWTYQFDYTTGRVTELSAPEGNREVYTHDSRGNITSVTRKAKPGSGLADIIVATADFDAACTNRAKCNRPNWTRDAKGNQTDYSYDPTTGVLTQVWMPAAANAVRPRVLNSYNWHQAWYKDPAGTLSASGQSILLLTATSSCNSAHACAATADEMQTQFNYGAVGVANNLSLVQKSVNSGNGLMPMAVAYGYDRFGNLETVDGPCPVPPTPAGSATMPDAGRSAPSDRIRTAAALGCRSPPATATMRAAG
jgi:YD repeat-containing protein